MTKVQDFSEIDSIPFLVLLLGKNKLKMRSLHADPKISEEFDWRSNACYVHIFRECITWFCQCFLACRFWHYDSVQSVWENAYASCSRDFNSSQHFSCGRIAFQVMVVWRNCHWLWIQPWNHHFRTCIFFIPEVCFLFAYL